MRKLFLFIFITSLFACSEMTETKTVLISGQIFNPASEYVFFDMGKDSDTAILDSTAKFTLTLKLEKPGYVVLSHGREITQMFLYPGDDVYLTLDTEEFDETINYSGIGALQNNYLASRYLINEKMNKNPREAFQKEEKEFMELMNKTHQVLTYHLDTFFFEQDEKYIEFVALEKNRMGYEKASEMLMYPSYYKYLSGDKEYIPSEGYYAFLEEVDLNNGEHMDLDEYKSLLQMYVSEIGRKEIKDNPAYEDYDNPYNMATLSIIVEKFSDEKVKNFLLKEFVMDMINYSGITREDTALTIFYANCSDTAVIRKVEEGIKKWEKIAKGQPAPGFNYPDINGEMLALDDLKGKYVYIDVWATWCGPCKTEIPYLKALEKEFHGRNIAFISISVDDSREDWEKMVRDKELGGIQLFGGAGWKSTITADYNIRGIPRFILIDSEGMIIDATAPRPSGDIKEILLALEGI
ncbi:MAG: TlpA disulfide reductase family protein [Bacteroidota bacterium]|nr:TlpA disulfide reductase family protein [Bacteroidota bacterium]